MIFNSSTPSPSSGGGYEIGTYNFGDDYDVNRTEYTVALGYRPSAVLIFSPNGKVGERDSYQYLNGGLILDGHDLLFGPNNATYGQINDAGFSVWSNSPSNSYRNGIATGLHYYIAFK